MFRSSFTLSYQCEAHDNTIKVWIHVSRVTLVLLMENVPNFATGREPENVINVSRDTTQ